MVKTRVQTHEAQLSSSYQHCHSDSHCPENNNVNGCNTRAVEDSALLSTALLFIATKIIRTYQLIISPLLGPHCRFYPSCSNYALAALQQHGLFTGLRLSIKRLCKCHPGNPGGIDDVPKPN